MKRSILQVTLGICFTLIPFLLFAQEKEITLEEVVVTATRDAQEIRKVPANVTVITKEKIKQSNAQSPIDLLRNEVGIIVRDYYGTGKNASVDIRGFGETGLLNTLVLVDGRRVNEIDLSGVDWTQIPLDQIERIEIVRGSGSVLYGDNAVGGVINIITKKPEKPFSTKGEGVIGSYHYHKESGSVSGKWGPLSAILQAGYNSTEGYRKNGFLRGKDIGGKIFYEVNDDLVFNFMGSFHGDDTGLPGGINKTLYKLNRRATLNPDNQASTEDEYGVFGMKAKLQDWGRLEMDFSFRHRVVDNFLDFPSSSYTYKDERRLETWGVTPKYILERPIWNFFNKLTFGMDFYKSDSEVDSKSIWGGFPSYNLSDISKRSMGLYFLDELSILNSVILSMGYRSEWVKYDLYQRTPLSKDITKENESAYNLSFDYLFGKKSSFFLSYKKSFRFPVTDELILVFPTFKVNPLMKTQTGNHYEAGIRHFFTEEIEADLCLFRIDLHDEIFYNPSTFTNENYSKTRRQGVELDLKIRPLTWLLVRGNYGYIKPLLRRGTYSGNDIPGVPRNKGFIGVDAQLGKGFLIDTKVNFIGSRYFISDWANQVDKLDEYYTVDAKFSYTWKGLKAFIGVNNLLNRKYSEYAVTNATGTSFSYYPSPERNFFGGISYAF